jgi:Secretion system C-terminal sorting domain/WD40-like Beta Propeller Repeat
MKSLTKRNAISILILFIVFILQFTTSNAQEVLYYCSKPLPSGAWQVYRKNLTTSTIDTITKNTAYNYWWVELSPDHTQLLMLRSPYGTSPDQYNYNTCEMVKANADGTNQQVILTDNQYGWFAFGNPHWHPNGNRILMIAQPTNGTQPFYIVTVDTSGNNPGLLTTVYSIDANWSPLGNKIVYIGLGTTGTVPLNFEVFTANYDYSLNTISNTQQLTSDTTRNQDPCFSPDGSKIAFSASNALITNADIISIDTSGNNRTTLLDDAGVHGGPVNWGSDGKIYHHSIYLFITGFTINAYNTITTNYETFCASPAFGFISPYYANLAPLSLNNLSASEPKISVYPNPTSKEFVIHLTASFPAVLELYDATGQKIFIKTILSNHQKINVDGFANGIYFYKLISKNNQQATGKVVIE